MIHTRETSVPGSRGSERPAGGTEPETPGGLTAAVSADGVCCVGGTVVVRDVEGHHGGKGIYISVSNRSSGN